MEGFLNPTDVLKQLKLREDMTAADFGCGSGGWVIPLAKKLTEGKVYAIDILGEPLSALKSRAGLERISNIETICSNLEDKNGIKLDDDSVDLILMTNLLFQVEDKKRVLTEAKRILKDRGKILIVDWLPEVSFGPKKGRVSAEEVKKIVKNFGLKPEKEFKAGIYHYGIIFTK